eukprot:TRINITY_DN30919_c0_g2_i1.p1 TRINITY_DN30919_c0_g2~~TRINITY_DN30919_c0_g2_i1.p1  ORF type:complete len:340 (-),score=26.34 TRINITY_DN30919_c0_g2_i1:225-1244(-)
MDEISFRKYWRNHVRDGKSSLIEVFHHIIPFLREASKYVKDKLILQRIGVFRVDDLYMIEDLVSLDCVEIFSAYEINPNGTANAVQVAVTESYMLTFELVVAIPDTVRVLSVAQLQSLSNIRRKIGEETTLVLSWRQNKVKEEAIQVLNIENAEKFLAILKKNANALDVPVHEQKCVHPNTILNQDLNFLSNSNFNFDEIREMIKLEKELDTIITIGRVQRLNQLYQNAIEFFSAADSEQTEGYEHYIAKIHALIEREDVRECLNADGERVHIINSRSESFDVDIASPKGLHSQASDINDGEKHIQAKLERDDSDPIILRDRTPSTNGEAQQLGRQTRR